MKITFTFTESADLKSIAKADLYHTYLELPSEALHVPDCRERVLKIAEMVGQLTKAVLHVSCKELDLKYYPVKLAMTPTQNTCNELMIRISWHVIRITFGAGGFRARSRHIKVMLPIEDVWNHFLKFIIPKVGMPIITPAHEQSNFNLPEQFKYAKFFHEIADNVLPLLNAGSTPRGLPWFYRGFHPMMVDNGLITRDNKRGKREDAEARRRVKQEERSKAREAQTVVTPTNQTPPKTGAGRRVGAVPGVFQGVQFRSQLEIRFVTQLEAMQIKWIYEGERLGAGNYLVDFYLPDLKCWVEVKGRVEPRDDYLLKEVATLLKQERGERLFIYSQTRAYVVNSSGFKELTHDEFWAKL